jgi:hypothetical protein
MRHPTTIAELLEQIRTARAEFDEQASALDDAALHAPGPHGWSAKDALAHVATWERRMSQALRAALGGAPPFPEGELQSDDDTDRFNAEAYAACRDMPASEVRAFALECHAEALAAIRALDDDDLHNPEGLAKALGENVAKYIADNTYGHYPEHLATLRHAS